MISKRQGSFETLSTADREVFHLFEVKCPVAARDAGCAEGEMVVLKRG